MLPRVALPFRYSDKAEPYAEAARAVGLEPVLLDVGHPVPDQSFDGLLLIGGTDVNPALYGHTPQDETSRPDSGRDRFEMQLLNRALEERSPVLAICRGLQFLNVARGGTLDQHVPAHKNPDMRDAHQVEVAAGTRLAQIVGPGRHTVNSRHHQIAAAIGRGLRVSALSIPDGRVEGLEMPGLPFVLAVQWHPEARFQTHRMDRLLFEAFAASFPRG